MSEIVPGWTYVGTVLDGQDLELRGVNPWKHTWERLEGSIEVPHPSYPTQRHRLGVWLIKSENRLVRFAAGELSNGVWCFYVPNDGPM